MMGMEGIDRGDDEKPFVAPPVLHEGSPENRRLDPTLRRGDTVSVFSERRGVVDRDWKIVAWDQENGSALIERTFEGKHYRKKVSALELYAFNRPDDEQTRAFNTAEWVALWNTTAPEAEGLFDIPREELAKERTPKEARTFIEEQLDAHGFRTRTPAEFAEADMSEEERAHAAKKERKLKSLFFR